MFKRYVYLEGLTNLLGSNGKYLINNDGQIKDIKGNDIEYHFDQDGNKVVKCEAWNGLAEYRVIDLMAIQFKDLRVPAEDYDKIIAFVIDGNKNNLHASNIGYRFKDGKLNYAGISEFYYVPGLTSSAINLVGNVISTENGRQKGLFTNKPGKRNIKNGYYLYNTAFANKNTQQFRHRALCLTFKEYPNNVDSLAVNHINGIPGDDRLENLEWVTYSENSNHAYRTGLRSQNMHLLVRNIYTKEISEYYSLADATKNLNYPSVQFTWSRVFTAPFGTIFDDGLQFKLKTDQREWIDPPDGKIITQSNNGLKNIPIIVRNCTTLEEFNCNDYLVASKYIGILGIAIKTALIKDHRFPIYGYQFKLKIDNRPWLEFTDNELKDSLVPPSFTTYARNVFTLEEKVFDSLNQASNYFNFEIQAIKYGDDKQILLKNGWQIKLTDKPWEDIKDPEAALYKLQLVMMGRSELTGEVLIAESSEQMGKLLNLDRKPVREAALTRGNKVYKGYRFRLGVTDEPWPTTQLT